MMYEIIVTRSGKNHAHINLGKEALCTIYGTDWKKKVKLLEKAFDLLERAERYNAKELAAWVKINIKIH